MTDPRPRVHLVQVCNAFGDAIYLPLSAGMLKACAESRPGLDHFRFETIVHHRFDLAETAALFPAPAVVGLSSYVWNWQFNLALARELRRLHPDVVIVIGGPQVPADCGGLLESGLIDAAVHGEGELTFAGVLEALRDGRPLHEVPGVTALHQGHAVKGPARARLDDLDVLPSPFLRGDFDPLLDGPRRLIGLWETNRGCPFSCTFCYWGSAVNQKVRLFGWERLKAELEWFSRNRIDYVLSADANFGIKKRDLDIARAVANAKSTTGFPRKFRVFSTKNASGRVLDVIEVLRAQGLDQGMSLTMQTLSPDAARAIRRDNIKLDTYVQLGREAQQRGIVTYSDLIVGLPGETYDSFLDGLELLMNLGQHDNVHVYHCTVLVGSELGDPGYQQKHGIRTIRTPILERHMRADAISASSVQEFEEIVVATDTMPFEDWVETNVATAVLNVLHYQKAANHVAVFLHAAHGASYRRYYEFVKDVPRREDRTYPLLARVWRYAEDYFREMGAGRSPRLVLPEYGDIVWPIEEAMFLLLSKDFDATYEELRRLVEAFCDAEGLSADPRTINDLLRFQQARTPRPDGPPEAELELRHDWPAWFASLSAGTKAAPAEEPALYTVVDQHRTGGDLVRFAREVVWYARSAADLQYRLERLEDRREERRLVAGAS